MTPHAKPTAESELMEYARMLRLRTDQLKAAHATIRELRALLETILVFPSTVTEPQIRNVLASPVPIVLDTTTVQP